MSVEFKAEYWVELVAGSSRLAAQRLGDEVTLRLSGPRDVLTLPLDDLRLFVEEIEQRLAP